MYGLKNHEICEYPGQPKSLALDITETYLELDKNAQVGEHLTRLGWE